MPLPDLPEGIHHKGGGLDALLRAQYAGAQVHWLKKRLARNGGSFGPEHDGKKRAGWVADENLGPKHLQHLTRGHASGEQPVPGGFSRLFRALPEGSGGPRNGPGIRRGSRSSLQAWRPI